MIIILKKGTAPQKVNEMVSHFEQMNFQVQEIRGVHETILGLIGDTSRLDTEDIKSMDSVAEVKRIQEPYKNANRKFHPDDTVVDVCGRQDRRRTFPGHRRAPARWRAREQMVEVAKAVQGFAAQACCAAAPSSPAPPPTPSRACAQQGLELPAGGQESYRPADCHRDHEHRPPAAVRECGHHPGGRAQHAEF